MTQSVATEPPAREPPPPGTEGRRQAPADPPPKAPQSSAQSLGQSAAQSSARSATLSPLAAPDLRHAFDASPAGIRLALKLARRRLDGRLTEADGAVVELVLAEVFNNIREHGYRGRPRCPVEVLLWIEAGGVACLVRDEGAPLPARCLTPSGDDRAFAEGLPEGGFGWRLIRRLSCGLRHDRENQRNHLRFRVRTGAGDAP